MIAAVAMLLAVAAEALVGYTIAEWFAGGFGDDGAANAVTFVVVGIVAFALPRGLAVLQLPPVQAALVTVIALWLALYAPLHIQFAGNFAIWDLGWIFDFIREPQSALEGAGAPITGAVLLLAVWARSTWRSTADIELELVPRSLAIPFAVVTVVLVLAAASDRAGEVSRAALAFYGVGLLALACSQLALSGATYGEVRAGGTTALMLGGTALATFVGVLVFGPVFALAVALLEPVVTGPLASGVEFIFRIILTPPVWLLSHFFDWLIGDIPIGEPDGGPLPDDEPGENPAGEDENTFADGLFFSLRILLVLGGVGVLATTAYVLARLRRRYLNDGVSRPQSETAGGLGSDLRGAFRSLFTRRGASSSSSSGPAIRLYLDVLDAAQSRGLDRPGSRTAREFAPSLGEVFHDPVTDEITDAFSEERYGGRSADTTAVERLRERWRHHRE